MFIRHEVFLQGHPATGPGPADKVSGQIGIDLEDPERAREIQAIYTRADAEAKAVLTRQAGFGYDPERPPRCADCGCPGMHHPTGNGPVPRDQRCRCGRCRGYRPNTNGDQFQRAYQAAAGPNA